MKYVKKAGYIVATIFFLVFTLGPFVWTFVMAITPKAEMFSNVVSLLPSHITWSNFQNLFFHYFLATKLVIARTILSYNLI